MYVTDTHPLIWYATNKHSQLSQKVLKTFQQADNSETLIYIPAVSLWEIAFERWVSSLLTKNGFEIVQLEPSITATSIGYNFNNDSFDKIIVASAIYMELPLITKDSAITESNLVEIYW